MSQASAAQRDEDDVPAPADTAGEALPDTVSPAPTFSPEPDAVAAAPVSPGLPGRLLREARERRGLTVADVANALKFGSRQIEALETDDYRALQGATFVRGFVRSYARFLKLAPEPLLAMIDTVVAVEPAVVRPPADTGAEMPLPGARTLSPWVAGAVVLLMVAGGLVAWHLMAPAEMAPRQVEDVKPPAPAAAAADAVAPPVARIEAAAGDTAAVPQPPVATVLPPDGRQLVLTFSDKSWVEIKDAGQQVILSGVFPGGDRQVANGKPPFQIWVGRASVVRILDGEREIDLKPHARDEVARLTVD